MATSAASDFYRDFFNVQECYPLLFIGPGRCARDYSLLEKLGVKHVVVANCDTPWLAAYGVSYLKLDLEDVEDEDVFSALEKSYTFIYHAHLRGEGVLVHCTAGISRSSAVAAAYMMRRGRMRVDRALEMIRKVRPWVRPNPSFQDQLDLYERFLFNYPTSDIPELYFPQVNKKDQKGAYWNTGTTAGAETSREGHSKEEGGSSLVGYQGPSIPMDAKKGCELCELQKRTQWYDENDTPLGSKEFVLMECDSCDLPMVVLRAHTMEIPAALEAAMRRGLSAVADRVLGKGGYLIDTQQRMIPDHMHWHARPMDSWWFAAYAKHTAEIERAAREKIQQENVEKEKMKKMMITQEDLSRTSFKEVEDGLRLSIRVQMKELVLKFLEDVGGSEGEWWVGRYIKADPSERRRDRFEGNPDNVDDGGGYGNDGEEWQQWRLSVINVNETWVTVRVRLSPSCIFDAQAVRVSRNVHRDNSISHGVVFMPKEIQTDIWNYKKREVPASITPQPKL